jgi:hypothetical protein
MATRTPCRCGVCRMMLVVVVCLVGLGRLQEQVPAVHQLVGMALLG